MCREKAMNMFQAVACSVTCLVRRLKWRLLNRLVIIGCWTQWNSDGTGGQAVNYCEQLSAFVYLMLLARRASVRCLATF